MTEITAVLDSNVLLDLYSCHDVYDAFHGQASPSMRTYRLKRAGDSLRLAICLHEAKAVTFCVQPEPLVQIAKFAPPGGRGLKTLYTQLFIFFVREQLLPNWSDVTSSVQPSLIGNQADRELLRRAKQYNRPLITNEGNTPNGIVPQNLRKLALNAGVAVHTPGEFCVGKISTAQVEGFMTRFCTLGPAFRTGHPDGESAQAGLSKMYDLFEAALHQS